jgi:hypothetical protein
MVDLLQKSIDERVTRGKQKEKDRLQETIRILQDQMKAYE